MSAVIRPLSGIPINTLTALLLSTPLLALAADARDANLSPLIERPTQASSVLPMGPLGYSTDHMDKSFSPRTDFYTYATGN